MPKERRRRRGQGGEQDAGEQDLPPLSTLADGGISLIDECDAEDESQREEGLTTLATLLAGSDRAALMVHTRLGPLLLERINDGSLGVRVAALGALSNLLLDSPVPPLGGDPTPAVLKNLAVGLKGHLNIPDAPMPKLPGLPPVPAAAVGITSEHGEEEVAARGEPGFDKVAVAHATRVALATQAAEALLALSDHADSALHALLSHEACLLFVTAILGSATAPAPGSPDLEFVLSRLALVLSDSPADLGQLGPPLAQAIAACLALPAQRFALPTRTAFAACGASLLSDFSTTTPLSASAPAILLALSDAMQPDANGMRTALVPQLVASPAAGLLRGTEEAESQVRQILRAQRLALEAVTNVLVSEDTEAAPDTNAEVHDEFTVRATPAAASTLTQHPPVYAALQAQLIASPLLLPLIARKCILPEPAPASVAADLKEIDDAFMGLLEAALDALLNYLLNDSIAPLSTAAAVELWNHLCILAGQLVARNLSPILPPTAQCLAALVRRAGAAAITPTAPQLDGLIVFASASNDTLSPFAIEILAALRRSLVPGGHFNTFCTLILNIITEGATFPPACLSAALNAVFDIFGDDFPPPDALIAALKALLPVLTQRLREQRRSMDPNEWEHLDEARLNIREFFKYKGVR